jgi:hypothetical protein
LDRNGFLVFKKHCTQSNKPQHHEIVMLPVVFGPFADSWREAGLPE